MILYNLHKPIIMLLSLRVINGPITVCLELGSSLLSLIGYWKFRTVLQELLVHFSGYFWA